MKQLAIMYYHQGYNCSQCILMAAQQTYQLSIPSSLLDACSAVNSGFGMGSFCSVLTACIMVLGMLFSADTAKRLRMLFLNQFYQKRHSLNCGQLSPKVQGNCEPIIADACDILEQIIKKEQGK